MQGHLLHALLWAGLLVCAIDGCASAARVLWYISEGESGVTRPLARVAGDGLLIAWLLHKRRGRPDWNRRALDPEPVSLVILCRDQLLITEAEVASAARTVFASEWDHPDSHVATMAPISIVQIKGWTFGIAHKNDRYFECTLMDLRSSPEEPLRYAAAEHRSWLSVDVLKGPEGIDWQEGYKYTGPLLAELVVPHALALGAPGPGLWTGWDPSLVRVLKSREPLEVFKALADPPNSIMAEAMGRAAAQREAMQRWPEFEQSFRAKRPGSQFFVLARITRGERAETAWLAVDDLDHERVWGKLDRDLHTLHLSAGAPVTIAAKDVLDWLVFDGSGGRLGHFTQRFEGALLRS